MRETTLIPVDGGLFALQPTSGGRLHLVELDGDSLESILQRALGPPIDDAEATRVSAKTAAATIRDAAADSR